jgi:hypothetical protein
MSAANPNPMEKSMVSVLVVANTGGGSLLPCGIVATSCVVRRERRQRVYLRSLYVSRTATGGRVASLCRAIIVVD